jgi:hypothetical protein
VGLVEGFALKSADLDEEVHGHFAAPCVSWRTDKLVGAAPRSGLESSSLRVVAFPAGMERMMRRTAAAIHYAT